MGNHTRSFIIAKPCTIVSDEGENYPKVVLLNELFAKPEAAKTTQLGFYSTFDEKLSRSHPLYATLEVFLRDKPLKIQSV